MEHHGLVAGNTFRADHVGRDIMASLENVGGGGTAARNLVPGASDRFRVGNSLAA